ncbi:MAG: hypothetical protein ACJA0N_000472 [Pseudohongiellaceae bacterium]
MKEAGKAGLAVEGHIKKHAKPNPLATLHNSKRSFYRIKNTYYRDIDHGGGPVLIHQSVKQRWQRDDRYRPKNIKVFIAQHGWPKTLVK